MLINKTISELLDAFASSDPTPGGGSASALAGAIAASLLAMVAGMPKTRTGSAEERASLELARTELLGLMKTLKALVDRDTAAYDAVVAAYRLPKATEAEKAARQAAIQQAFTHATDVPLDTMRACAAVLRLSDAVAASGNPSADSDVQTAVHLARAGFKGALHNVEINLGQLKDPETVRMRRESVQELVAVSARRAAGGSTSSS